MQKSFWIILIVAIVGLGGIFIVSGGKEKVVEDPRFSYGENVFEVQDHDHKIGNGEVVITGYGDFQCPACQQLFPDIKQIEADYADETTVVFRHFPLTAVHPNAMAAHRAAEAAGIQGKFFEMHDLMYQRQSEWSQASNPAQIFEGYAQQLGLDVEKFRADISSEDVFNKIQADMNSGNTAGATSTPTVFVNGQLVDEFPTYEVLSALIDKALGNDSSGNEKPANNNN